MFDTVKGARYARDIMQIAPFNRIRQSAAKRDAKAFIAVLPSLNVRRAGYYALFRRGRFVCVSPSYGALRAKGRKLYPDWLFSVFKIKPTNRDDIDKSIKSNSLDT